LVTNLQIAARKVSSVNPATGEVLREFECASESEVQAVVARARAAQPVWAGLGVRKRIAVLREFQRRLIEKKIEIAEAITREAGKPVAEALTTEVLVVLDAARFLIENAFRLLRDEPLPHGSLATRLKRGRLVREPYGLIGIISPWNYPFSIPATETLAALVAGNAVVLKPSEFTSLVALELQSLLHAAGLPRDVFQAVVGDGATGAVLVHSKIDESKIDESKRGESKLDESKLDESKLDESKIDKLVFTGSVATGKRIATAAAERLLPVVLELGGKDPMLVLDDADVDIASSAAVWGAFMNAGQTCLSLERCYVHRSLYEKFLGACVEKTNKLRVGNGFDPETDVGPMIHARQLQTVETHVEDAVARGARLLAGGSKILELGKNFYKPTVLANVTHAMRIMREETFGPVLPVMAFDSDEEAIRLANDSEFGLAASVFTRDNARGERLARQIQAGTVMVNDVVSCFGISEAPHGGVKSSGVGRTHGRFGLEEMVRLKYLDTDLMPGMKKVWWYGYGAAFARQMQSFQDFQFGRGLGARVRGALRAAAIMGQKKL
jgi:succinate-semialdehyde dehydrogenase/glutarate-semialdehyde dehydrogenase